MNIQEWAGVRTVEQITGWISQTKVEETKKRGYAITVQEYLSGPWRSRRVSIIKEQFIEES